MLPSVLPTESDHVPVLAEEVVSLLDPRPGETIVDGTFGAGGLVDELRLMVFPVVLGAGKRLFAGGADATALKLVETRQTGAVAILTLAKSD